MPLAQGKALSQNKADELVKSRKTLFSVIPVKTGIQEIQEVLDSRSPPARGQASFSGSDDYGDFLP
jgi:hypothetical protein